jgi:predicted Zn-dependent protease
VPSARAQDASGSTTSDQCIIHPVDPPVATTKLSKKLSKYSIDQIGHRGVGKGANDYTLEEECQLGRELSEEIETTATIISDPTITEYVDRLGQTIVRHSDAQFPFTIKVVESEEISALAVPGGYVYVNSGLILAADSEAELAGVMAHEIAHIAARHATRAETRMRIFAALSMASMYVGGPAAAALQVAVGVAGPASFVKFSRDAEREADLLGLEYEYAAGYDPQAVVRIFERLHFDEKHKHDLLVRAFASHSMTADRVRRAQDEISTLLPDRTTYIVDTSEFQEVKSRLAWIMHDHASSENGRPILHRRTRENNF